MGIVAPSPSDRMMVFLSVFGDMKNVLLVLVALVIGMIGGYLLGKDKYKVWSAVGLGLVLAGVASVYLGFSYTSGIRY